MLPAKPISSSSHTQNGKTKQIAPRGSKLVRGGSKKPAPISPSSLLNSHSPVRRSLKSTNSKLASEVQSSKVTRPVKTSESQRQIAFLQEELNRIRGQLVSVEQEKVKALEGLKDANRVADENYGKYEEALIAQKKAEESSKIAKIRADGIEQAAIEAARKKEEDWKKELDVVRNQHDMNASALSSTVEELERVRKELILASDARITAIRHFNDAKKIAEVNAEKVESLTSEVGRLESLLNANTENSNSENQEIVRKLNSVIDFLNGKLEKARLEKEKFLDMEALIEVLGVEENHAKKGEADAHKLINELKSKVELLEAQLEETNISQRSSLNSLDLATKQLEDCKELLQNSDAEIAALKMKVKSSEFEVIEHNEALKEMERCISGAQQEASEKANEVNILNLAIQNVEKEKLHALNDEKALVANLETLSEENKKLTEELQSAGDKSERDKEAMERLASDLQKVSLEARKAQEKLFEKLSEMEDAQAQIEQLSTALRNSKENYELMLDEARYEIVCLKKSIERYDSEAESLKAELNMKKLDVINSVNKSEDDLAVAEADSQAEENDEAQVPKELTIDESEATEAAMVDATSFKERLLDIENELQCVSQENSSKQKSEAAAIEKIKELSILLSKAKASELLLGMQDDPLNLKIKNADGNQKTKDGAKFGFSSERENDVEAIDDELDSTMRSSSFRHVNEPSSENLNGGSTHPRNKPEEGKKKKALLNKFGYLVKRKSNQK
ncbi:Putative WEB family protein [Apostasia shenzhenica]|uniref:WEB family protein n=1 Tax=Apostasia shenzhenica TaxID=1088818 RepID=A0A2I0A3G6_9ASPA|nr:Putative WEB family protein [Apostasia shenzhenica]